VSPEERAELERLRQSVAEAEQALADARTLIDAAIVPLRAKYRLRPGDRIDTDTGEITRAPNAALNGERRRLEQ
jgi:DNA-binding SARP family transcriptional activator